MKTMVTLLLTAVPLVAAPPREAMDEAIDRGLLYLRRTQDSNTGAWSGMKLNEGDPAVTALAVMAFLSAGHVPGEGRHGQAIEKAIRYVMNRQKASGLFAEADVGAGAIEMYHHGICTLMLAEAAGMTSGNLSEELKQKLVKAVSLVLAAQRPGNSGDAGGWRYRVEGQDADLSVSGWQLMALRAARNLGCDIPQEKIEAAVKYIRRCYDRNSGGFHYAINQSVTVPCTGTAILALELCGKEYHRAPELLAAGDYILKNDLNPREIHFFYGIYYTSQGMFQLGDPYWKQYRPKLHNLLLKVNPPKSSGAWHAGHENARDDAMWGPNYCTSMAILALTVEYRLLPIYQRFEEPVETE